MLTKAVLRREMIARLRAQAPADRARAGEQIARRVWELPEVAEARVLLLYASLPEEVPTDSVASEALRRGVTVLYPRSALGGSMALHQVGAVDQLQVGRFGIREPDPAVHPQFTISAMEAALTPGLAWDRTGRRLGRGGGFYDRLLASSEWKGFRCGAFFAAQEVPSIPADPWDIPLECVVTEREVWLRPGMADPASP